MFVYETEEIYDKLRAEIASMSSKEEGATTIAFFDFTNMGTFTSLLYVVIVASLFGYAMNVLYKAVQPEPDFTK